MKKTKNIDLLKMNKLQLIHQINTITLDKEILEESIKDELYKIFMDKLREPQELQRLKKENKNLRDKVKTLKNLLKGDKQWMVKY